MVQPLMIDLAREEQKMAGSPQYMRRGATILECTMLGKGSRSRARSMSRLGVSIDP